MAEIARKTQVITGVSPDRIPVVELLEAGQPAILKGLARDWPLVRSGLESPQSAIAYLRRFAGPAPITVFLGHPDIAGRFFYNDEFTGFNFKALKAPLGDTLDRLTAAVDAYLRSHPADYPGFGTIVEIRWAKRIVVGS
jgi:hypothetical protein